MKKGFGLVVLMTWTTSLLFAAPSADFRFAGLGPRVSVVTERELESAKTPGKLTELNLQHFGACAAASLGSNLLLYGWFGLATGEASYLNDSYVFKPELGVSVGGKMEYAMIQTHDRMTYLFGEIDSTSFEGGDLEDRVLGQTVTRDDVALFTMLYAFGAGHRHELTQYRNHSVFGMAEIHYSNRYTSIEPGWLTTEKQTANATDVFGLRLGLELWPEAGNDWSGTFELNLVDETSVSLSLRRFFP